LIDDLSAPEQFRVNYSSTNGFQKLCNTTISKLLNHVHYFGTKLVDTQFYSHRKVLIESSNLYTQEENYAMNSITDLMNLFESSKQSCIEMFKEV